MVERNELGQFIKGGESMNKGKSNRGWKHSDEAKLKISIGKKGMKFSAEHRAALSRAKKGKPSPKKGIKTGKPAWNRGNGKGHIDVNGYKRIRIETTNGMKEVKEHQYIWMKNNNYMPIPKGFCIHHINGNKVDNSIKNLILLPANIHGQLHARLQDNKIGIHKLRGDELGNTC